MKMHNQDNDSDTSSVDDDDDFEHEKHSSEDDSDNDGQEGEEGVEEQKSNVNNMINFAQYVADIDETPNSSLGRDQNKAFTYILQFLNSILKHEEEEFFLIIHGGPGSGKSTFTRALVERIRHCHYNILCCAPTGIAASLLIEGRTVHSLLGINLGEAETNKRIKPLSATKVIQFREDFTNVVLLLIDETSMMSAPFLSHISSRLQQIKKNKKPFGGIPVVLVGDFFQLKPVAGTSFYDSVMNDVPINFIGTPFELGRDLIVNYKMITLTQQFRSLDNNHTEVITRMRDTSVEIPINNSVIDSLKVLSSADIDEDPSWAFATIAVCSNAERHALNSRQVVSFAKVKGFPVLRWNKTFNTTTVKLVDEMLHLLYEDEPTLTGFFVKGAPIIVGENLNPSSGIANGTPAVLHSLRFSSNEVNRKVGELISRAKPGDIIDVPVPYAIMVTFPTICRRTWKHLSLSKEEVVFPLVEKSHYKNVINLGEQKIKFYSHSHDLAFALTYHKLQGQTKEKVILDLNLRPAYLGHLSFQSAYVGLTRVNFANNMRIFPSQDNKNFSHLLQLKPDSNLTKWLDTIEQI